MDGAVGAGYCGSELFGGQSEAYSQDLGIGPVVVADQLDKVSSGCVSKLRFS